LNEQKRLAKSDSTIQAHHFFVGTDHGYNRELSELSLHQVLRKIVRSLEKSVTSNQVKLEAAVDTTLLHPPAAKPGSHFYPAHMVKVKEYRAYYQAKQDKKERGQKAHQYRGHLRSMDALHSAMRGGADREAAAGLYQTVPSAMTSVHSKTGWKDPLSKYSQLASSDPRQAEKEKKIKLLFEGQGKWIKDQRTSMEHTNDRFEHLVHVLRTEIENEHKREGDLLKASKRERKGVRIKSWMARFQAVDRILDTLSAYGMFAGLEKVDFLLASLNQWKAVHSEAVQRSQLSSTSRVPFNQLYNDVSNIDRVKERFHFAGIPLP